MQQSYLKNQPKADDAGKIFCYENAERKKVSGEYVSRRGIEMRLFEAFRS